MTNATNPPAAAKVPSWKDVANYRHLPAFTDRNSFFLKIVKPSGYPYFSWNDRLYQVEGDTYVDTGYTTCLLYTSPSPRD